ncbi:MAG: hypothetical protein WBF93_13630 [Pirellulales bacterium]|nr:hypothetical protein [Pirellulales bacterium]
MASAYFGKLRVGIRKARRKGDRRLEELCRTRLVTGESQQQTMVMPQSWVARIKVHGATDDFHRQIRITVVGSLPCLVCQFSCSSSVLGSVFLCVHRHTLEIAHRERRACER